MADTPNQEIATQASQTRTANEIAAQKAGSYQCLDVPKGSTQSPQTTKPFQIRGA